MKKYFKYLLGLSFVLVIFFVAAFSLPFFIKEDIKNIEGEVFSLEERYYKMSVLERKMDSDPRYLSEDEALPFIEFAFKELKEKANYVPEENSKPKTVYYIYRGEGYLDVYFQKEDLSDLAYVKFKNVSLENNNAELYFFSVLGGISEEEVNYFTEEAKNSFKDILNISVSEDYFCQYSLFYEDSLKIHLNFNTKDKKNSSVLIFKLFEMYTSSNNIGNLRENDYSPEFKAVYERLDLSEKKGSLAEIYKESDIFKSYASSTSTKITNKEKDFLNEKITVFAERNKMDIGKFNGIYENKFYFQIDEDVFYFVFRKDTGKRITFLISRGGEIFGYKDKDMGGDKMIITSEESEKFVTIAEKYLSDNFNVLLSKEEKLENFYYLPADNMIVLLSASNEGASADDYSDLIGVAIENVNIENGTGAVKHFEISGVENSKAYKLIKSFDEIAIKEFETKLGIKFDTKDIAYTSITFESNETEIDIIFELDKRTYYAKFNSVDLEKKTGNLYMLKRDKLMHDEINFSEDEKTKMLESAINFASEIGFNINNMEDAYHLNYFGETGIAFKHAFSGDIVLSIYVSSQTGKILSYDYVLEDKEKTPVLLGY